MDLKASSSLTCLFLPLSLGWNSPDPRAGIILLTSIFLQVFILTAVLLQRQVLCSRNLGGCCYYLDAISTFTESFVYLFCQWSCGVSRHMWVVLFIGKVGSWAVNCMCGGGIWTTPTHPPFCLPVLFSETIVLCPSSFQSWIRLKELFVGRQFSSAAHTSFTVFNGSFDLSDLAFGQLFGSDVHIQLQIWTHSTLDSYGGEIFNPSPEPPSPVGYFFPLAIVSRCAFSMSSQENKGDGQGRSNLSPYTPHSCSSQYSCVNSFLTNLCSSCCHFCNKEVLIFKHGQDWADLISGMGSLWDISAPSPPFLIGCSW